ncbi:MAG: UDP-N-acetylmuramoyl-L-alanyl-D-glutamate--2,6-diaminopimelate ligase [Lachnospiraceae bacterium]|nr:UDP-N-acetylmuramoyl-L-alanyl-D-glutamate--2,6-diaminopimelate ligase [Lachnospiraceae bacterium]
MKLNQVLEGLSYEIIKGDVDIEISQLIYDSRKTEKNSIFVCLKGANFDGHSYIREVVTAGAKAVVVCEDVDTTDLDATFIKVLDTRYALAILSANYFENPAKELVTIGITGTKGKTTTTYMVREILESCDIKTGLIGTIETIIGDEHIKAANTTPESYIIQKTFREMVEKGCKAVVMEVSSQGLMMHRCAGIMYDIGVFTNLEPDHIGPNEHSSFEEYTECKAKLFKQCKVGIVNSDDKHFEDIIKEHTCTIEKYGFNDTADYVAKNIELINDKSYIGISFKTDGLLKEDVVLGTPGRFSVYNALCAIAVTRHFDIPFDKVKNALKTVKVKGRVEIVDTPYPFILMIDYAHNAMSLENILTTLKEHKPKRLVCMFGCGGNRAKSRRYEMGEVSGKYADFTVITSDNPRFEKPEDIIADIVTGIEKTSGKYIKIIDRREAIKYVIQNGKEGDVIVLAGKGHEDYQEIEGKKYPMDERVIIAEILEELK